MAAKSNKQHEALINAAHDAIEKLYTDRSVTIEQTIDALDDIATNVEQMLDTLSDEFELEKS